MPLRDVARSWRSAAPAWSVPPTAGGHPESPGDRPEGSTSIKVSGAVEVNVSDSIAFAVRAGMGIGRRPVFAARQGLADGSLIRVLPQHTLQRIDIYARHPSRRYTDARTKTWVEFLRTYLPRTMARNNESLVEVSSSPRHSTEFGK
ncbi:LysR substrate-binding domain-containing protein [Trinickia mobilis]|uniref:LysR substrate-binding domain-containing protein n=1 Tax=Trinickia mobilis TaxID=2816356 RepID=UPI001A8DC4FB